MKITIFRSRRMRGYWVWVGVDPVKPWSSRPMGRRVCYSEWFRATRIKLRPGWMVTAGVGRPRKAPQRKPRSRT